MRVAIFFVCGPNSPCTHYASAAMVMTATKLLSALRAGTCCEVDVLCKHPDLLRSLTEDGMLTVTESGIVLLEPPALLLPLRKARPAVGATVHTSTRAPRRAAAPAQQAHETDEDDEWVVVECA